MFVYVQPVTHTQPSGSAMSPRDQLQSNNCHRPHSARHAQHPVAQIYPGDGFSPARGVR